MFHGKVQGTLACCKLEAVIFALEIIQATDSQTWCLGGSSRPPGHQGRKLRSLSTLDLWVR